MNISIARTNLPSIQPPPCSNNVINFGGKLNFHDSIASQTGSKKQKVWSWMKMEEASTKNEKEKFKKKTS